jgi:putative secreted M23 family peptidase
VHINTLFNGNVFFGSCICRENNIKISCEIEKIKYIVWYAHLFPNISLVSVGDKVSVGQKIAEVGTTGYSTGTHLHFQVIIDGKNVVR